MTVLVNFRLMTRYNWRKYRMIVLWLKLCPYAGLMILSIRYEFQRKRMFRSQNNDFARKLDFSERSAKCEYFLQSHYLENETSVFAGTLSVYYGSWDLLMGKVSSQNSVIRYFCQYLVISRKSSKTVITPEGRQMSLYSFWIFSSFTRSYLWTGYHYKSCPPLGEVPS
jgi:hypothetical protein